MSTFGREVLVITHFDGADLSWINLLIREQGMEPVLVRPFAGELLPEPENAAAVICLGGPQNAYEDTEHSFLIDEQKFLRRAVEEHVPIPSAVGLVDPGAELVDDKVGPDVTQPL